MSLTQKKIAELAGVSIGTVDRILHNRGQVSKESMAKVNAIIEEFGYEKNIFASRLALNKDVKIVVFLPNSDYVEYWGYPLKGIKKAASMFGKFGLSVEYYFYNFNKNSFIDTGNKILENEFEGIIFAPIFKKESKSFIEKCHEKNISILLIDSILENNDKINYVSQNAYKSGYLAAKLALLDPKLKKIFIANMSRESENTYSYSLRKKGFYKYFEDNIITKIDIIEIYFDQQIKNTIKKIDLTEEAIVYVPNSRSYLIAEYFEKNNIPTKIIGFDLLEKNKYYLEKGNISFLINQKPKNQGFRAVEFLYKKLILKEQDLKNQEIHLEIIVKENCP